MTPPPFEKLRGTPSNPTPRELTTTPLMMCVPGKAVPLSTSVILTLAEGIAFALRRSVLVSPVEFASASAWICTVCNRFQLLASKVSEAGVPKTMSASPLSDRLTEIGDVGLVARRIPKVE